MLLQREISASLISTTKCNCVAAWKMPWIPSEISKWYNRYCAIVQFAKSLNSSPISSMVKNFDYDIYTINKGELISTIMFVLCDLINLNFVSVLRHFPQINPLNVSAAKLLSLPIFISGNSFTF